MKALRCSTMRQPGPLHDSNMVQGSKTQHGADWHEASQAQNIKMGPLHQHQVINNTYHK